MIKEQPLAQPSLMDISSNLTPLLNPEKPIVEQEVIPEATFEDKLYDTVYDSAAWGMFRTAATLRDLPDEEDYRLTQEQIDAVQKELGDYTASLWVCQNAKSDAQLERLTKMKKDDLERRKRVDNSEVGFNTIGTLVGTILDPINYIPFIGATGKVASAVNYVRLAAVTATSNVVERGIAQTASGYEQNYQIAGLMGAVAGGAIPFSLDMLGKGFRKVGNKILTDALNMERNAKALADGTKAPNQIASVEDFVANVSRRHDASFVDTIEDIKLREEITPERGVYAVSLEDAKELAAARGIELEDNVKAVFDDESGVTFLIKENMENQDIRKVLLHEQGSHGLKFVLSEGDYNKVIAEVKMRLRNNPSDAMKRAVKRAGGNSDVEEVLGYLAEELKPSNPLMRNIKKKLDKSLNALGFKGRMSDEDFIDLLTKSAKHYAENKQGYRKLSDGSCVFQGFHYSKTNIANPDVVNDVLELEGRSLKDTLKRSAVYSTPHSVCSTSRSSKLREAISRLILDPEMRKALGGTPAERYKSIILNRAKTLFDNYLKARDKALVGLGKFSPAQMQEFNEQVIRRFNAKYAGNTKGLAGMQFDDGVEEAVECLHELRTFLLDNLRDPQKTIGAGEKILSEAWQLFDDEFYRLTDNGKWLDLVVSFNNDEDALIEFLENYAMTAIKDDVLKKQILHDIDVKWNAQVKVAKEANKELPVKETLTDEIYVERKASIAKKWARGVANQGASMRHGVSDTVAKSINDLDCVKYRVPMDTSVEIVMPNGNTFSFDSNLRSYDLDSFMPNLNNRISGEVALTTAYPHGTINVREDIRVELQELLSKHQITAEEMNNDLKAFDVALDKLRGFTTATDPKDKYDGFAYLLNSFAYNRDGGNMVFNQFGELAGTIAYEGVQAVFDLIPGLRTLVTEARMGKGAEDMLQEGILDMWGDTAHVLTFYNANSTTSKLFRNMSTVSKTDKVVNTALDYVTGGVKASGNFMSYITGFSKLTALMVNSAQKQTLIDVVRWVNGVEFPKHRNPFSDKKLAAIGLGSPEDIAKFRQDLARYIQLDNNGNLTGLNIKKLQKEKPKLYTSFYALCENQVMRCITTPTIGNTSLLREKSPFWKVFFMFKDFTMRATHSQTLRALSNKERDDVLATIYSAAMNTGIVLGLSYAKSKLYYKDDEAKQKAYMDKYFEPFNLARLVATRGAMGSALSPVNDALEAIGVGGVSTRTTVYRNPFDTDRATLVGRPISQLPAVRYAFDTVDAAMRPFKDAPYTERDYQNLVKLLPGQNNVVLQYLRDEFTD